MNKESDYIIEMMKANTRRRNYYLIIGTFFVIWLVLSFFVLGLAVGMKVGFYTVFEGIAIATQGATINGNITIDLNETQLVNEFNKTIIPQIISRGVK